MSVSSEPIFFLAIPRASNSFCFQELSMFG